MPYMPVAVGPPRRQEVDRINLRGQRNVEIPEAAVVSLKLIASVKACEVAQMEQGRWTY